MKIEDRLYTLRWKKDEASHLVIVDEEVCRRCEGKPCTSFCPAQVYDWEGDHLNVAYEGCLECGTCRIGCPYRNIAWRYPRGGYGLAYRFG